MDVVTELAARLTGYVGLLQDALVLMPPKTLTSTPPTTPTAYPALLALELTDDNLPGFERQLRTTLTDYPDLAAGAVELAAPEKYPSTQASAPPTQGLETFVHQALGLLQTLLLPKRKLLLEGLHKRAHLLGTKPENFPPPEQWRYAIRSLLYNEPQVRQTMVEVLAPYEPVMVRKAKEVLQKKEALTPEKSLLLLLDDSARDQVLREGECALPFEVILRCELQEVEARRHGGPGQPLPASYDVFERARTLELCGLAFSGGGIRSATFNLGILQMLASYGWLPHVDYLSTVSGGSYLGAWFTAWVKRAGALSKVVDRLCPNIAPEPRAEEVRPIRWLRMFSNYLAPNPSIMSKDSWTLGLTWLRNTVLNQLILVLALGSVLALGVWLRHCWQTPLSADNYSPRFWTSLLSGLAVVAGTAGGLGMSMYGAGHTWPPKARVGFLVTSTLVCCLAVGGIGSALMVHHTPPDFNLGFVGFWVSIWRECAWIAATLLAVLLLVAIIGRYDRCFYGQPDAAAEEDDFKFWPWIGTWVLIFMGSLLAALVGLIALVLTWKGLHALFHTSISVQQQQVRELVKIGSFSQPPGATLYTALQYPVKKAGSNPTLYRNVAFILGLPVVVETLAVTVVTRMALLGRNFPDERREWWGRMGAVITLAVVLWLVLTGCILLGNDLVGVIQKHLGAQVAATGWVALVLAALRWAYSERTPAQPDQQQSSSWLNTLLSIGPYAFGLGVLLLVANALQAVLGLNWGLGNEQQHALVCCALLALLALLLAWRVDVNEFSLHHFYRNRLTRAYLGASRRRTERAFTANPFTSFDRRDDVKLCSLRRHDPLTFTTPYDGPYLIINTALNATVISELELDRQDRKAESFVFTAHYCGFDISRIRAINPNVPTYDFGYRPTRQYAYPDSNGPGLGTALTISGAAVNPNRGYSSSPASAFLLTLFNIRLGWWIGNPRQQDTWRRSGPGLGLLYLLKDLVGRSATDDWFVNLSDGGHFDNMGLYELVRRRCRYIILGDGEEDHLFTCEGLANAIRRCLVDFGVEIKIDVRPITNRTKRISSRHYAVGTINYPDDPPNQPSGYLLYLKTSLTGEEPTDVREYADKNAAFPHQSTADQFFSEPQFESYRRLGMHIIQELATSGGTFTPASSASLPGIFAQLKTNSEQNSAQPNGH
ncbi:patatin-like phospholipase domain-containing protein [Hymenobacter chitinivorans]|uniref:Patatin-like phospholipase n=1 Tax=Hymenobacter chitinivorans DSM 11115 TaxID=1121954 RepID=A0A2M9AS58_9BACT|nr:hypothetical protein [Hymenobacter chitinivorans]PJJ48528.1 patatin-like phospholipase [Hymenobacter chitinivorans DSM 11115]